MHAIIAWQNNLNASQAAGDIIAILTGETDKNNLSAQNLPGGTTIASTIPAGWEIWDAATGVTNEWVLRAPTIDDPTQYKYLKLRFFSSSSYLYIVHSIMEAWDVATNTPTNETTDVQLNYSRFPTNSYSNNTMQIVATAQFIIFRTDNYADTCCIPIMEISRTHPCLAIGTGRVPAISMLTGMFVATNLTTYNARIPRMLDDAGTTDLINVSLRATNNGVRPQLMLSNEYDNITQDIAYDSDGNPFYGVQLLLFERRDLIGQVCGDSSASDFYIMQGGVLAGFEDQTLHTLDTPDDRRVFADLYDQFTSHGNIRYMIRAE